MALEAATTPAAIDAVLADGDRLRADVAAEGRAAGAARRRLWPRAVSRAVLGRGGGRAARRLSRVGAEPPRSSHRRGRRRLGLLRCGRRRPCRRRWHPTSTNRARPQARAPEPFSSKRRSTRAACREGEGYVRTSTQDGA